jgi:hypothetical protein
VEIIMEIQVGSTITNGSSAIRVTERVAKDQRWGTPGWRGECIRLEQFGNASMSDFVPDYLLSGWYHLPFEWRACIGGQVEERYVWSPRWTHLQREVRRIEAAPVDCTPEHGVGHPDCPKCWRWSERNPNRVARPTGEVKA